ncbi:MAG TPA: M48 family metallopeptidase [Candidatus Bilamarchaeum sp.]|nr:M48 family metallopeptidase [Candidatus Bilamarchaeum sp.]
MEIEIGGTTFSVDTVPSANRNAVAKLRGRTIVISLPSRWPASEKERVWKSLLGRAVRAIERGKWKPESSSKVEFSHGQKIFALGKEFEIAFVPHSRFRSRTVGRRIEINTVEGHPEMASRASRLVRRELEKALMPELEARVHELNRRHFCASLGGISLRDNTSRWGSCSPDGSISLSIRLLFMPGEILDYVIVHEIAHTRYRSHGPRFWALVERAVPDHKGRRKWLRENGWKYPGSAINELSQDCPDEPY